MKRQPTKWKKIFADLLPDKGPISKTYKRTHTTQQPKNNPIKK